MLFSGVFDLPWWGYALAALALTHVTIASVTIYLHRCQAHRALELHPLASHFFRFWVWLTTGMVTKEWAAIHRKHHAKCETPEDPHSPQIVGINRVLWGGVFLYVKESHNRETMERYGHGTPDDWLENNLYSKYRFTGIGIMLLLDLLLFGLAGAAIWVVQMVWIPFWAAGVINGLGHFCGYRNFETADASRNLSPLGILNGGEELHNNHHAYPYSARLSSKWWEFDIGWLYIRLLAIFGLAQVRRVVPAVQVRPGRQIVDLDTLRAVLHDRYHILKLYGRKVVGPAVRAERHMSRGGYRRMLRRVRRLMTREDIVPDTHSIAMLNTALQGSHLLETVYHFKKQLKTLWTHSAGNNASRLEGLEQWCRDAERSGIQALREFADMLRGYTLQTA